MHDQKDFQAHGTITHEVKISLSVEIETEMFTENGKDYYAYRIRSPNGQLTAGCSGYPSQMDAIAAAKSAFLRLIHYKI